MRTFHMIVLTGLLETVLACGGNGNQNTPPVPVQDSPNVSAKFVSLQELQGGTSLPYSVTPMLTTLYSDSTWTMTGMYNPETNKPLDTNWWAAQLSPDGTKILLSMPVLCTAGAYCRNIGIADANGQNVTMLTHSEQNRQSSWPPAEEFWSPQFAPDGKSIIYVYLRNDISALDSSLRRIVLSKMNLDGSNVTTIFDQDPVQPFSPTYSPDGQKIAFEMGNQGIATMNADGTDVMRLTGVNPDADGCSAGKLPAYSGDSQQIVFVRECVIGDSLIGWEPADSLYSMKSDGSGLMRLFGTGIRGEISYEPRTGPKNTLFFSSNIGKLGNGKGFDIYYIDLNDANLPVNLSNNCFYDAFSVAWIGWSPFCDHCFNPPPACP